MKRLLRHVLLPCLLTAAWLPTAPACGQDTGPSLAVVLYLSADTLDDLKLPLTEIRRDLTASLARHYTAAGYRVIPAARIDAAVGRWRVRDERSISQPFLDTLHTELGASLLLVAHLRAGRDGMSLRTRMLQLPVGLVRRVQWPIVSWDAGAEGPESEPWRQALLGLCRELDTIPPSSPTGPARLLLPADPVGCEPEHAMAATCALLQEWLQAEDCRLPDPALVYTFLAQAGVPPSRLDASGRHLLSEQFGARELWRLSLIAYGQGTKAVSRAVLADDSFVPTSHLPDFDLNLRRIDLETGLVLDGGALYLPAAPDRGWFGTVHRHNLKDRIGQAAARMQEEHSPTKENQR